MTTGWHLRCRRATPLRLDLRSLSPAAMAGLSQAEAARLPVWHGNEALELGEVFMLAPHADGELLLEGDLAKADRIGWQLAGGRIRVEGDAGDYLGAGMSGGEIVASGHAGVLAACEMSGGRLEIAGNAGDFAASALPGSMDGMRGGTLLVRGSVGARFADRMRRGSALVFGNAGDFVASRMVAGTVAVAGRVGAHAGLGMRRGTLVLLQAPPAPLPTFAATAYDFGVIWGLLARDIARAGGPFAGLPAARPQRLVGDLSAEGKGELLLLAA